MPSVKFQTTNTEQSYAKKKRILDLIETISQQQNLSSQCLSLDLKDTEKVLDEARIHYFNYIKHNKYPDHSLM